MPTQSTTTRSRDSLFAGIDLGGTNMQIGVVSGGRRVIGRSKKKTPVEKGAAAIVDRIAEGLREACTDAGVPLTRLRGIGIGAPGAIDLERGVVREAPNLRWNGFPLAKELSKRLGRAPILVDNDVNVAVWGESRLGAARGARDVLGVWVGTGIGGGLILDGKLYSGAFGSAGEIGQMAVFPGATLGNRLLEEHCSRKHIARRLAQLVATNRPSILPKLAKDGDITAAGASTLAAAYRKKDALTREVIDESADVLGRAIGGCVTLLSLGMVILGGGLSEAMGAPYVNRVAAAARSVVFPSSLKRVKFVATTLEDDAGLLGAALLARERFE